jgi:putative membrane protein
MKRRTMRVAVTANSVAAAVLSAVVVMAPALGWAQAPAEPDRYYYGPHMVWGGGWYGMVLGPLFMILVLVAVFAGVALVARWFGTPWYGAQPPPPMPPGRAALDILKERFARGEIDKDEYEERRRVLGE